MTIMIIIRSTVTDQAGQDLMAKDGADVAKVGIILAGLDPFLHLEHDVDHVVDSQHVQEQCPQRRRRFWTSNIVASNIVGIFAASRPSSVEEDRPTTLVLQTQFRHTLETEERTAEKFFRRLGGGG